jgi:hypothetical protein
MKNILFNFNILFSLTAFLFFIGNINFQLESLYRYWNKDEH